MLYKARRALAYWRYDRAVAAVLETPPLRIVDSPLRIVSMVAVPRDLRMYLVAIKSLYARIGHGRMVVLPDRPLSQRWRDLIRRHVDDAVTFLSLDRVEVGPCQRGGAWERLLTCLDLSVDHYVVQMDCDTLALGELPEVCDSIAANRAFALREGVPLQTLAEAAAWAKRHVPNPSHIVDIAQHAFAEHPERERLRYIRASAGFAGFARGGFERRRIEEFHATMERIVGVERWRAWGTEQVASNFAVANSPDPVLLPHPDYCNVVPTTDLTNVCFGHFIGSSRFDRGRFAEAGIAALRASGLIA